MPAEGMEQERKRGGLRKLAAGVGLVAAGGAAGLVAGTLLEAPRLVLRSWLGPVQVVELESLPQAPPGEVHLLEFDAIQSERLPAVGAKAPPAAPLAVVPPAKATPRRSGPVVQVRAYDERDEAERLVAALQGQGFDAFVSRTRPTAGARLRVRVAPRAGEPISQLAERLETLGYDTWTTAE
ncbi:MAG: SPOR domain-containing protein [Myxococcota bacterium]